ncbi:MAG: hypothetical protein VXY93_08330 [Pseudomonadota bacterium]|nr:hypothetical protein [Pseudomonadota bacterium]
MSELEALIIRWSALSAEYPEPCRKAWQIAYPEEPYNEQSEIDFMKQLIGIAKCYIDDEEVSA